jgi:hypothetical protein
MKIRKLPEGINKGQTLAANPLASPRPKVLTKHKAAVELTVELFPLGRISPPSDRHQLRHAIYCVLQFLQGLHKQGFVHCDIRWPNVISCGKDWYVIDYETVSRENTRSWRVIGLDDQIINGTRCVRFCDDIQAVARLIEAINVRVTLPPGAKSLQRFLLTENCTAQLALQNFDSLWPVGTIDYPEVYLRSHCMLSCTYTCCII